MQVARGFRTKASAAEEWSGSPSAVAPVVTPAAAASSPVSSANLLAAKPVFVGVLGVPRAFQFTQLMISVPVASRRPGGGIPWPLQVLPP